jgi:hypothetical protein
MSLIGPFKKAQVGKGRRILENLGVRAKVAGFQVDAYEQDLFLHCFRLKRTFEILYTALVVISVLIRPQWRAMYLWGLNGEIPRLVQAGGCALSAF